MARHELIAPSREVRGARLALAGLGVVVIVTAVLADWLTGQPAGVGAFQLGAGLAGVACCLVALRVKRLPSPVGSVALVGAASLGTLLAAEGLVRLIGFDLTGEQAAFDATPIWFRQATEPVGEVFFRRSGPAEWTGRVLSDHLERRGIDAAYPDERAATFSYDSLGFRNPIGMDDWEVVVIGDSFVELGHLPYDELHTSRLASALGERVKNLGVSGTGTLTHTYYLQAYGKGQSTRDAVLVFYEGNDVRDLEAELAALERLRSTGNRDYRTIQHGASIVRAVLNSLAALRTDTDVPEGTLSSTQQRVSIAGLPPTPDQMGPARVERVQGAIEEWVSEAEDLGLRPWVVLMPANRRVYHHELVFDADAPAFLREWTPSRLPQVVEQAATSEGARFIDLTPALRGALDRGQLPYNPIWDTHLNRVGAQVVADVLTAELSAGDAQSERTSANEP